MARLSDKITRLATAGWIILVTAAYFFQYKDKIAALAKCVIGRFPH